MRMRTLLVDDERPARERMRKLLGPQEGIEVVGEAENGEEALSLIEKLRPDVVFLDIQMPGQSGLEVAGRLRPPRPKVIYCTAFDRYAVAAFEQHAVDYLLKPISRERLERSLDRLRGALSSDGWTEEDRERAEQTQARLFPQQLPDLKTLDYIGFCRPVQGVGGDYFDFFTVGPGKLALALADVSGKGMAAALLMAGLQGRLQSIAPEHPGDPAEVVGRLNRSMRAATEAGQYVTLFYGVYDDRSRILNYVNAGHNAPLLLPKGSERNCRRLTCGGPVVGIFPDPLFEAAQVRIDEDDLLLLFTDGLSEAMDPQEREYGEEGLAHLLACSAALPTPKLCERILKSVTAHVGSARLHDDLTVIIARGKG